MRSGSRRFAANALNRWKTLFFLARHIRGWAKNLDHWAYGFRMISQDFQKQERGYGLPIAHTRRGQGRRARLHRAFLQSETTAPDAGLSQSDGVRNECHTSLSWCQPSWQQPKSVQFRKDTPWLSNRITVCSVLIATVQRRHGERKNSESERKNLRNAKPSA